jgi:hypothetical protein
MPIVGLPFRTRSLKLSFRLSRTDWIKQEVQYIHEPDTHLSGDLKFFFPAQKSSVSSPLSFAGRIAKPLRGGGGGTVPRATSEMAAPPVVPVNPLARVQNEERYATVLMFHLLSSFCLSNFVPLQCR